VIRHLVFWKFSTQEPAERAALVAEMDRRFGALVGVIDGTERLEVRADLGETAGNWDVVLDADYRDAAALAAYQTHPAHVEVASWVRSLVVERACVDFAA
jgi:Stress responsive A/B Barrel Domain.